MKSGKREIAQGTELPNQENIRSLGEIENYKYFGILKADTIKQTEMEEKIRKASQKNMQTSGNKILSQKSHQKYNLLGSLCKILRPILKKNKGTQTNGPKNKGIDDCV